MTRQQSRSAAPRVLIVSASVGAGHNQAAGAIADSLAAKLPQADLEVVDILTLAPRVFRAYYAGGYSLAVTKFPRLYGLGFRLNDRPHVPRRGLMERFRLWNERQYLGGFERFVRDRQPDVLVNVHFLGAPVVARMLHAGQIASTHMVVITDIRMHRFWYSEGVDRWFAPAEPTAERLRRWGIEPGRITVSGMPIHAKWTAPLDRRKVLAEWRLPADKPIVVLAGGAEFTCGPIVEIAREILARSGRAFLAVLAGRNKKLLAQLSRAPEAGRGLVGIAFTDRVHELVEVCSLVATKAGGLSTAECLAKGKPMVLLKPVPGQESGNAEYFAREGAGVVARDDRDVIDQVSRLLDDPGGLHRMGANARRLYRPGRETIVEAICRAAGGKPGPSADRGG